MIHPKERMSPFIFIMFYGCMICTGCTGCRWYVQAIWASHMICSSLLSLTLLYLTRKLTDPKLMTRSRSISKWEQCSHHKNKNNINWPEFPANTHKSGGFWVDFSRFPKQKMEQPLFAQRNGQVIADAIYTWARELLPPRIHVERELTWDPPNRSQGKSSTQKMDFLYFFPVFFVSFPGY